MTDIPQYEDLIRDIEKALITASALKSKLIVELLRMAILAVHEDTFNPDDPLAQALKQRGDKSS